MTLQSVDGDSEANDKLRESSSKFAVFRFRDAREPVKAGVMTIAPMDPEQLPAIDVCMQAGIADGADTRLVFRGGGMSIVNVWFKTAYPLPLHTHNCDCLYYIIGGTLRLGTEELGTGDGFFVPANVPYTYTPGEHGVELVEFRNSESFDLKGRTTAAFWAKALSVTKQNHEASQQARRPSPMAAE